MSEFADKVEQFKQTMVEPGFKTEEILLDQKEEQPTQTETEVEPKEEELTKTQKRRERAFHSYKSKIEQLAYENQIKEAQTQELLNRVQYQEQLLAEKQQQLEHQEAAKEAYYETNLQTQEAALTHALKVAKEEGNIDAEIALSKELSKIAAQQSTYGLYKAERSHKTREHPYYEEPMIQDSYPIVQPSYEEPENEAYSDWLESNEWANPQSSHYSQKLRSEVDEVADTINESLRFNKASHMIGTPEYFQAIDSIMRDRYGTSREDREEQGETSYVSPSRNTVAPVSRRGSSMADQYMGSHASSNRRGLALSEDEYKIARNLQIKLPNGRYATGDEAVRRYSEAKRLGRPDGSNKLVID